MYVAATSAMMVMEPGEEKGKKEERIRKDEIMMEGRPCIAV